MLDVKRVANNTGQLCSIRNDTKHFVGLSLRMLLVFDWGVFELARGNREKMEWFGDRCSGDLSTDLFGEEDALLDRVDGEIRPVSRERMFLNIKVFLLLLFPFCGPVDGRARSGPQEGLVIQIIRLVPAPEAASGPLSGRSGQRRRQSCNF